MIKNENIYEVVMMLRPEVSIKDAHGTCEKLVEYITVQLSGIIHKFEYWGLRELEYKIKKAKKAHFYMCAISVERDQLIVLEKFFKFNDLVVRHLVIKSEDDVNEIKEPSFMIQNIDYDKNNNNLVYDNAFLYEYKSSVL